MKSVCMISGWRQTLASSFNPPILRTQLEGGVIFGLSNCLKENLTISKGIAQQTNFHEYQLLRMREAPAVHVELITSMEHPTGAGEAGTIIAPCQALMLTFQIPVNRHLGRE